MDKAETATWAANRVRKFHRDLGYVAPELYAEKFELLAREIEGQILRMKPSAEDVYWDYYLTNPRQDDE